MMTESNEQTDAKWFAAYFDSSNVEVTKPEAQFKVHISADDFETFERLMEAVGTDAGPRMGAPPYTATLESDSAERAIALAREGGSIKVRRLDQNTASEN